MAVCYGLSQFCIIQFPPHSFYTSVYIAVARYRSCAYHVCAKSTNKNVNFAICRYNDVRALNKRVKVYPESLLRLSKEYRGNFSEKNSWSCILGTRSGVSDVRMLRGDYPSAV
jgi:hypothetical protein